jgi:hypothetical protein
VGVRRGNVSYEMHSDSMQEKDIGKRRMMKCVKQDVRYRVVMSSWASDMRSMVCGVADSMQRDSKVVE